MVFDKATLNRIYRYCLSLTNNADQAYDLMQSALEKYLRNQSERESTNNTSPENPMGYMFRIVRNAFIDTVRRAKIRRHDEWEDGMDSRLDPTESNLHLSSLEHIAIEREQVEQVLALLTEEQRELLFLWAVEGYTIQEIADMTQTPKGTLLSRVHRLRQSLLRILPPGFTPLSHPSEDP